MLPSPLHLARLAAGILTTLLLSLGLLWLIGLWVCQPISLLPAALPLLAYALWWLKRRKRPAHTRLWLAGLVATGIATYGLLPGPQPNAWQVPWAHAPQFELNGNTLTIHHLRDFRYRSEDDYAARYITESYPLDSVTGVDFAECHWDGHTAICHTMMSFSFADGRHLVISPETRLPVGEKQNAICGLYKRYGLLYVFGTEDDIFALRTNYRHEDLFLMPMKVSSHAARAMLLHFVALQQKAEATHAAYNTLAHNCSSGVMATFRALAPSMPWHYDLAPIHNASISRILFRHHALQAIPGEDWDSFQKRSYLGYDIPLHGQGSYSRAIRSKIGCNPPQPASRDNREESVTSGKRPKE